MNERKCCKNCDNLNYWDGYNCLLEDNMLTDKYIEDIENNSCDNFTKKVNK